MFFNLLGLKSTALATDATIQKNHLQIIPISCDNITNFEKRTSNEEMEDIMRIIKSLLRIGITNKGK